MWVLKDFNRKFGKEFIAILIGYFSFTIILHALDILPSIIGIGSIILYAIILGTILIILLVILTVKNFTVNNKIDQSALYILFGVVMVLGWVQFVITYFYSYEFRQGEFQNIGYHYYNLFKSNLLYAKFALALAFIWYNFKHYRVLVTIKHIMETFLLLCILLTFISVYEISGEHSELILNVTDLSITYYSFLYLYFSIKKDLLGNTARYNNYIVPIFIGILLCLLDVFVSMNELPNSIYILSSSLNCLYYIFALRLLLQVENARDKVEARMNNSLNRRAYAAIKDNCSSLLDAALFVYILNVINFNRLELIIFCLGLIAIVSRHILIGMQRNGEEYEYNSDVFFANERSKEKLFKLGVERTDRLFSDHSSGVCIINNKHQVIAYNRKLIKLFDAANPLDIAKKFKPIDCELLQEKIKLGYSGIRQEINIRRRINEYEQKVYEIIIEPISVNEIVKGIEIIVTDHQLRFSYKTAPNSLSFESEAVYSANTNIFINYINEDLRQGLKDGCIISVKLPNIRNWWNFLPAEIIEKLKFDYLDSIEQAIPKNSIIFDEGDGTYLIYLKSNRRQALNITQKICEDNFWTKSIEEYTVQSSVYQGIYFQQEGVESVAHWIYKSHLVRTHAEKELIPYLIFEREIKENLEMKYFIQNNIRDAIEANEFFMVYQPKVDSDTKQIVALEALVRWIHPEKGFISPGEFIPIAEESNDIILLGTMIFKEVVRQQIEWKEKGVPIVPIAINVGTKQFDDEAFVELLQTLYRNYPLKVGDIAIELTERDDIAENKKLRVMLSHLKEIGYDIQIDDFGVGKTILGSLAELPISTVKLDRSIVSRIKETNYYDIIKSIKYIADKLHLKVISEGVETKEEVQLLRSLGCSIIQGYYFYRPLPVDEIESLLVEQNERLQKNLQKFYNGRV